MKKKWSILLLTMVLTLGVALAGCGNSDDAADTKVLNVWAMGDEAKQLPKLAKEFEKDTGIKVKVQAIPWANAHDKLLTAVASKSGPDVVQMGTTWMPEFVAAGALEDLDSYTDKYAELEGKNFFDGSAKTTKFDDKTYAVPWYADTRVLFYRTDILKKEGYDHAPKTWDELSEVAKKLSDRGDDMYGLNIDGKEQSLGFMFGRQNGSPLFDDANKPVFNKKPFVDSVSYLNSFFQNGSAPKAELGLDVAQTFGGDAIIPMFISGPWMVKAVKDTVPDIDGKWATAVLPAKENNTSSLGGANLAVFKYGKNKDDAGKFLQFMSKPETQLKWMELTNSLPTVQKSWENETLKDDPFYKIFGEQMANAEPMPLIPEFEEIAQAYMKNFEQIYRGGADVQDQMDNFNKEVNTILKNN
ncbi:sugar ABC transporter substrate-binding protein [Listeria weihenstephanensis]|uniref:Sugar ABC transporter substrate-binding protein n=1 Tax=Listeria weihenstephanensis TaxID=1006155 RepID=A0A841Z9A8_9LIST|nr:sugar ABC transporter substrate-binding protein [Listeria weihenstephanensis]MBC1500903.1 sugar ABC transporter substrate-binding protein [Listeria weihenstephanensis]